METSTSTLLSTITGSGAAMAGFNFWQFLGSVLLAWVIGKALDIAYKKLN